jgi:hypothetical protein
VISLLFTYVVKDLVLAVLRLKTANNIIKKAHHSLVLLVSFLLI